MAMGAPKLLHITTLKKIAMLRHMQSSVRNNLQDKGSKHVSALYKALAPRQEEGVLLCLVGLILRLLWQDAYAMNTLITTTNSPVAHAAHCTVIDNCKLYAWVQLC
jgi:hypothetical protein